MTYLQKELKEMESYFPKKDTLKEAVSRSDVAWHLSHSLMVIAGICDTIQKTDPSKYNYAFNMNRFIVFSLRHIPRGRGKAPKIVRPKENITLEQLQQQLKQTRKELENFDALDKNAYFKHPYFGLLNKANTMKFLKIHTKHHLKIMRDILK